MSGLQYEVEQHERIRFRREEMVELDALPSAAALAPADLPTREDGPGFARAAGRIFAVLVTVVLLAAAAGTFAWIHLGGADRLALEAEAAVRRISGMPVRAELGDAGLSIDRHRFLALYVDDVRLVGERSGAELLDAGTISFGIRFLPLLGGKVRVGSAGIENARISLVDVVPKGGGDWSASLRNARGLIDPGRIPDVVFQALNQAFDALDRGMTDRLSLSDVDFVLPPASPVEALSIEQATLSRSAEGEVRFHADVDADGRKLVLDGTAIRHPGEGRIASLSLKASAAALEVRRPDGKTAGGSLALTVTGREGEAGRRSSLVAEAVLSDLSVPAPAGLIQGSATLKMAVTQGVPKAEITAFDFDSGRTSLDFHGAIGPNPAEGPNPAGGPATAYRYELVSDGSTLAPVDSPEPALTVFARMAGLYDPQTSRLSAEQIGIRSGPGEVYGTGHIDFVAGKMPGYALAIDVGTFPVAHAKQVWPWLTGRGARLWVLKNVYGGTVVDSHLRLDVPPGTIGNGMPLTADEIDGHFELKDTRFDLTGDLPAVRDAYGTVDISGTEVRIGLSAGSAFMASGRSVAVKDGTLLLADTHLDPVIGKLDISVAGDAPAVVEFASSKPIDAMRRLEMVPEDVTGSVTGRVSLDFPLASNVRAADLDWRVALAYSNLSLDKEFDGQRLTDAKGTIDVDPGIARIKADGKLNGIAATLALTEPLDGDESRRDRDVSFKLDDRARAVLAPGLDGLLSGPVSLKVDAEGSGKRAITADLTAAKLLMPWIGWSKGAGVPAKVAFSYEGQGGNVRLTDFLLSGASFSIGGDIRLAKGSLQSAKLDNVQLNRGDDVAVSIDRAGGGYAVKVRGQSFDARSVVKQILATPEVAGASAGETPVTVDLAVDRLSGFGGEGLRNVRLAFSGVGASTRSLDISAVSKSGGAVSVRETDSGGRQSVQVQSADAGAVLRFLDIYSRMQGGTIKVNLDGSGGVLKGPIDARNFDIVNEPRLASLVGTAAPGGNGKTLSQAVRRDIDVSRVTFERGFAMLEKRDRFLAVSQGAIRGQLIGATFQGTLYDPQNRMAMTGTFMPAYGLNRIFAEIPLVGAILGNGRDRGLIGITFKLAGPAAAPQLQVNPISVIAPGVFRSIFEF